MFRSFPSFNFYLICSILFSLKFFFLNFHHILIFTRPLKYYILFLYHKMQYFIFLRVLITIPSLFHRFWASFFKLEFSSVWWFLTICSYLRDNENCWGGSLLVGVTKRGVSPLIGWGVKFHWRNSCLYCQCQYTETFSPVAHFSGKASSGICQTVGLLKEGGGELQTVT